MANRKYRNQTKRSGNDSQQPSTKRRVRFPWGLTVFALIIPALVLISQFKHDARISTKPVLPNANASASIERSTNNQEAAADDYLTADSAWDSAWPALPGAGEPARPLETVRAAYAFAARREDIVQYIPCYCGCERQGHHSLHDCFVKAQTPAGAPQWDQMGFT
jgi:hypothetical protein